MAPSASWNDGQARSIGSRREGLSSPTSICRARFPYRFVRGLGGVDRDAYAILSVGGFLGMGTHLVAVPFSEIRIVQKEMQLPDATKDSLEALPEFKYAPN